MDALQFLIDQWADVDYHYAVIDYGGSTVTLVNNQRSAHAHLLAAGALYPSES